MSLSDNKLELYNKINELIDEYSLKGYKYGEIVWSLTESLIDYDIEINSKKDIHDYYKYKKEFSTENFEKYSLIIKIGVLNSRFENFINIINSQMKERVDYWCKLVICSLKKKYGDNFQNGLLLRLNEKLMNENGIYVLEEINETEEKKEIKTPCKDKK